MIDFAQTYTSAIKEVPPRCANNRGLGPIPDMEESSMGILRKCRCKIPGNTDLTGMQFGFWTVLARVGSDSRRNKTWRCRCICGSEKTVGGQHLRYGSSKSCGCKSAGLRGVRGEKNYSWKGGSKNRGSLAWCNARIDSLRQCRKRRNGGAAIVSTGEDVMRLWQQSLGKCTSCDRTPEVERELHLDHDKATGVVRGFICDTCNVAIGMAGDSPERLRRMAAYLERHLRISNDYQVRTA